ncbi:hypothetical protein GCM10009555_042140 [Acrocarpospora macrocephala]|uniref:Uncharacterized protein n=1 Tax=Acrocarpospora macrocephala TaxID=150177 RepID=A0A5M3X4E2_9ACTN|nr:hypothetical protein [Acrocarpospora macrocephala]GES13703.1 hypothetical protein Amac_073000 [Acrocarpospora macrocephala]
MAGAERRGFRPGALALPLCVSPLALGWALGAYGTPPPGVSPAAVGVHRIMVWLVPLCVAAVVGYGTARTGTDPRVAATARLDLRWQWWTGHLPVLAGVASAALAAPWSLSVLSGEPYAALLVPELAGVVVALCAAAIVNGRFAPSPGAALGATVIVTGIVAVVPYLLPFAHGLALDATLANWARGEATRGDQLSPAVLCWLALAGSAVVAARFLPRDVSRLRWLTMEASTDD